MHKVGNNLNTIKRDVTRQNYLCQSGTYHRSVQKHEEDIKMYCQRISLKLSYV